MNERIWELWLQAQALTVNEDSNDLVRTFAELIVRECIDQCVHTNHNNQWDKGIAWAVGQIKQHFGVEV